MSARRGYQPFPDAKPLCFLHVQKTGGASAIAWLESMFPADRVAPCRNPWEFEALRGEGRVFDLYAGHILGGQLDLLPRECDLFTILRDPAQIVASAYYHRRAVGPTGGGDRGERLNDHLAGLCRRFSLEEVLNLDHPSIRFAFWDTLTRFLGATESEHFDDGLICGPSARAIRDRQITVGRQVLSRALVVGDHATYNDSLLLLAAERGWPAPPILPRFHDFNAPTNNDAARDSVEIKVRQVSPADYAIYDFAKPLISQTRSRLAALAGEATSEAVNARHAALFFTESSPLARLSVDADAGWAGYGWSLRERDGDGNAFRRIADERTAVILARVAPGPRRFRLRLWNVDAAALDGLAARANGQPLERLGLSWEGRALCVDWALPVDRAQDLVLEIEKPASAHHAKLWVSGCAVMADISA